MYCGLGCGGVRKIWPVSVRCLLEVVRLYEASVAVPSHEEVDMLERSVEHVPVRVLQVLHYILHRLSINVELGV